MLGLQKFGNCVKSLENVETEKYCCPVPLHIGLHVSVVHPLSLNILCYVLLWRTIQPECGQVISHIDQPIQVYIFLNTDLKSSNPVKELSCGMEFMEFFNGKCIKSEKIYIWIWVLARTARPKTTPVAHITSTKTIEEECITIHSTQQYYHKV